MTTRGEGTAMGVPPLLILSLLCSVILPPHGERQLLLFVVMTKPPPPKSAIKAAKGICIRLVKAIAQEGCVKEVMAGDFIAKYRLRAASSVKSALNKLLDNELVYKTPAGYIIYDRMMAEWLRSLTF